jgi:hypothetical protein
MYFLGMLLEKNNFDGGAGADFIAMAVFILFVLLVGLVFHGINAIGKHIYCYFFPHQQVRKSEPFSNKKASKNR